MVTRGRWRTSAAGRSAHFLLLLLELSKRDLGPHRKRIELRAGIARVDRTYLPGDVAVQIVEHEPDVAIDVPVQGRRIDPLSPPGHTVGVSKLIVEIDRAEPAELTAVFVADEGVELTTLLDR